MTSFVSQNLERCLSFFSSLYPGLLTGALAAPRWPLVALLSAPVHQVPDVLSPRDALHLRGVLPQLPRHPLSSHVTVSFAPTANAPSGWESFTSLSFCVSLSMTLNTVCTNDSQISTPVFDFGPDLQAVAQQPASTGCLHLEI